MCTKSNVLMALISNSNTYVMNTKGMISFNSIQVRNSITCMYWSGWWPLDLPLVADLSRTLSVHQLFLFPKWSTQESHAMPNLAKGGGQAHHHSHTHYYHSYAHQTCKHRASHCRSGSDRSRSILLITFNSSSIAHYSTCTDTWVGAVCTTYIDLIVLHHHYYILTPLSLVLNYCACTIINQDFPY